MHYERMTCNMCSESCTVHVALPEGTISLFNKYKCMKKEKSAKFKMDNIKIILTAITDSEREKGLMYHRPLEMDECAVFVFPTKEPQSFWNKNVDFPISIIFCKEDGTVIDIKSLEANQESIITLDSCKSKYAIETHKHTPREYGITKGRRMQINIKQKVVCPQNFEGDES